MKQFKVENLVKSYRNKTVINGFSYTFTSGLYLLTGNNGIGKSTLLKLLARLVYPSNKNYYIQNIQTTFLCEKIELLNIRVSVFLKRIMKLNHLSIDLPPYLKKWGINNQRMDSLSKGNRQKCAILMTYFTTADLYLFDEPTDALDDSTIINFLAIIKDLCERNKIVIVATHEKKYFQNLQYQEITLNV